MTGEHPPQTGGRTFGARTLADELRDDLSKCEKWVAQIDDGVRFVPPERSVDAGDQAEMGGLVLLQKLDRVADELERLEERGADMRAERVRFENVLSELRRRDKVFVVKVGPAMAAQRPADARWWWYLDEQVAAKRWRRLKWAVAVALAAVILLGLLYVLYDRFLAAPPNVRQANSLVFHGEKAAIEGDVTRAVEQFERATVLDPENAEAQLWLGVLYQMTGSADQAPTAFGRAQALLNDQVAFWFQRGVLYLALNDNDAASKDALSLIELVPGRPEGYFLLGSVAEKSGDLAAARDSFQKAAELADETGAVEMEVTARIRLGTVLQQLGIPSE